MKEYKAQLEFFSRKENREQVRAYFEKYWLSSEAYEQTWKPIKDSIFIETELFFPDIGFQPEFELMALSISTTFKEEDFKKLRSIMKLTGDRYFVIIQDHKEKNPRVTMGPNNTWVPHPPLRFIYPATITWDELMSGGEEYENISHELFREPYKEYFIFGDSGVWGKYAANDPMPAVHIFGFKKEYSKIFRQHFPEAAKEHYELLESSPEYREFVKLH